MKPWHLFVIGVTIIVAGALTRNVPTFAQEGPTPTAISGQCEPPVDIGAGYNSEFSGSDAWTAVVVQVTNYEGLPIVVSSTAGDLATLTTQGQTYAVPDSDRPFFVNSYAPSSRIRVCGNVAPQPTVTPTATETATATATATIGTPIVTTTPLPTLTPNPTATEVPTPLPFRHFLPITHSDR